MKHIKKCLALVLTLAMMVAMGVTAYAYDVTITPNSQDKGTHTYGAYQIFKGNLDETTGTLGNIVWGSGISEEGKTELGDAAAYAETITAANAAEKAAELAKYLTTAEETGSAKIKGLEGGYYLIQDETTSPTGTDPKSKTKFILKVVKDETVQVKSSVPSVEKKVDGDKKAADHNIGDVIPYTSTATIGDGIANFDSYSFRFVDTMSKGLTLDQNDWDIKVGEKSIKNLFTLTSASGDDGATVWTWAATDIKAEISDGAQVVLSYKATLNKDAVITSAGNPNTVKVKFDNDPNNSGKGTPGGDTPEDKAIVFTYKTIFNKVDGSSAALTGADFKLEKKVDRNWVDVTTMGSGDNRPSKTGSTAGSTFTFAGLADGEYRLTETTTPAGYNTMDPVQFTIDSTFDETKKPAELKTLTGSGDITLTPSVSDASLTTNVVNNKGTELPSTGGIGTTIFYVLGGILVVGAGVVLITRKRMGAQK